VQSNPSAGAEASIHRLDVGIRQLKIQYDMFFAGALDHEPVALRAELESIIKRYSQKPMGKYAQRFHFNALVSRFNTMSELWGKTLRSREEGSHRMPGAAEHQAVRERLLTRCTIQGASIDEQELRRLHARFVDANRLAGEESKVPFDRFARGVAAQAQRLRKQAACDQIELRLVVRDDKVQLKARPGR
jgi:hypothetical protein